MVVSVIMVVGQRVLMAVTVITAVLAVRVVRFHHRLSVLVMVVVMPVMVVVPRPVFRIVEMVCRGMAYRLPQEHESKSDQRQESDAAPKHVNVQLGNKNIAEQVLFVEHDRHPAEQATDADGAKLFQVKSSPVMLVGMSHR
jgi:hypothetical protein